jgi:pantothenate kinase type III
MARVFVIDVGNSRVAAALWTATPDAPGGAAADATLGGAPAGTMRRLREWPTPRDSAARTVLAAALTALTAAEGTIGVAIASVVPPCGELLMAALPGAVPADHTSPLPFALGVAEPAAVGADRYCNLAAAVARGWRDALVVDAGTATTFDLLTDGCFRGGLIAPGMAFAAQRLGETAARLSPVPFASCPLEVGASTAAAMQAGAFHVGVRGVLGVVDGLLERYGSRPVVVTGGLGAYLARPGWLHDPDWTLRGALRLAWPALRDRPAI